ARQQNTRRENTIDQDRIAVGRRLALLKLWPVLRNRQRVDREFFPLAMEDKLESVSQELPQHRHLLVKVGPNFVWSRGDNIVAVGLDPRRAARDRPGGEIISSHDKGLQRIILRGKP